MDNLTANNNSLDGFRQIQSTNKNSGTIAYFKCTANNNTNGFNIADNNNMITSCIAPKIAITDF